MTKHTYDMGVVGNCAFLALIGTDTAVRWLCWPRFDSSFVFGSLLDEDKGGEFSILPADGRIHEPPVLRAEHERALHGNRDRRGQVPRDGLRPALSAIRAVL
ncbi:MAG: trehalase-like domain-containing protein [Hymenobacter sp.]